MQVSFLHIGITMDEWKSVEEWLELVNELRAKQGKVLWKLEYSKRFDSTYKLLTVEDEPINPSLGKKYRKYDTIKLILTMAYTLLQEYRMTVYLNYKDY